jgi:predicted alpha/beta hydrolase family esterase
MKKRAIIIHGYAGYPNENWFQWLKDELKKKEFEVFIPAMPNTNTPQLREWLPTLRSIVGEPDNLTYLIGHSLGSITILRHLESLKEGQQIGGAVLVAGFSRPIHITELNNFFEIPLDYEKCRIAAGTIICINSDNDEHVPLEEGEVMRDKLGAKLIVIPNGGHLNQKAGFTELPIVTEEILGLTERK